MLEHPYNAHPQPAARRLAMPTPYPLRPVVSDAHVTIAWICAVLTIGYMLPWAIAATRRRPNSGAIGALNLLAGWTFVGWIVALVMACGNDGAPAAPLQINVTNVAHVAGPPPGWYPGAGGSPQYWDGGRWIDQVPQAFRPGAPGDVG